MAVPNMLDWQRNKNGLFFKLLKSVANGLHYLFQSFLYPFLFSFLFSFYLVAILFVTKVLFQDFTEGDFSGFKILFLLLFGTIGTLMLFFKATTEERNERIDEEDVWAETSMKKKERKRVVRPIFRPIGLLILLFFIYPFSSFSSFSSSGSTLEPTSSQHHSDLLRGEAKKRDISQKKSKIFHVQQSEERKS